MSSQERTYPPGHPLHKRRPPPPPKVKPSGDTVREYKEDQRRADQSREALGKAVEAQRQRGRNAAAKASAVSDAQKKLKEDKKKEAQGRKRANKEVRKRGGTVDGGHEHAAKDGYGG